MPAEHDAKGQATTERELRVLNALCRGVVRGAEQAEVLRLLQGHRFSDALHAEVFRALCALPPESDTPLEQHLAAQLTRRGFPDVNLEPYFAPSSLSPAAVLREVRDLLTAARDSA